MTRFDVTSIGNAIVDVLTQVPDSAVDQYDLNRGSMTLIDAERAEYLTSVIGDRVVEAGGSAGNTAVALAGLGAKSAYIGKVANDQLGDQFDRSLDQLGVHFSTQTLENDLPTARCLIFVTPDGDRTMNTFLGASTMLKPADIDPEVVGQSKVTYMEGYLWDPENAKQAFRKAIEVARAQNRETSLSLSDPFCVDRYRSEFRELMETNQIDILFANEDELKSLYDTDDYEQARQAARQVGKLTCVTRGTKGSEVLTKDEVIAVPAFKVPKRLDTTGAGDLYAAGFLYGYTHGMPLTECGMLANRAGAAVIQRMGARLDPSQYDAVLSATLEEGDQ